MKTYQLVIFLAIVLTIYSLSNVYIFVKGFNATPLPRSNKIIYTIIFIVLATTFIAGKFLEARHSSVFSDALNIIGGFWLGFMLYGTLFLFISDIAALVLRITGVFDSETIKDYRKWAYIATVSVSIILITSGFINSLIPRIKEYNISINKSAGEVNKLKIAAVSDIHLGSLIRKRSMKKLSAKLEEIHPDLVLLLGDIVDGELGPVLRDDLLKYFTEPHSKDGLYAITGNHEFIGGAKRTIPYIESKGIRLLKDEVVELPGGIQMIGRIDRDATRFYGKERMTTADLMKNIDLSRPVIMLDHQPVKLREASEAGVDLQLSGHTHNGQMWPLNYVVRWIYELSYGYLKKGNTHIIVSSGFGLWGPRIRLGSRSEILVINLTFNNSATTGNQAL